jgi:hypothetical protein
MAAPHPEIAKPPLNLLRKNRGHQINEGAIKKIFIKIQLYNSSCKVES